MPKSRNRRKGSPAAQPGGAVGPAGGAAGAELLAEAVARIRAGRPEEAWEICRRLLEAHPDHAQGLHLAGELSLHAGDFARAAPMLERAVRLQPGNAGAALSLGNARQASGDRKGAVAAYRQALAARPDLVEAHVNLGNALQEEGETDAAEAAYRRAIALKPDFADAHFNLGVLLAARGRAADALAAYARAAEANPRHAAAHNNRGVLLKEQKKFDEAAAAFRNALAAHRDFPECLDNLGATLVQQEKPEEALDCFRRAVALRPRFAEAHVHAGLVLARLGLAEDAIAAFRQATLANPGSVDAHGHLAAALETSNRLEEAKAAVAQALERAPGDVRANLVAARLERREGEIGNAVARLNSLRDRPHDPETACEIAFDLGFLRDREGDAEAAFANWTEGNRLAVEAYGAHRRENEAYLARIDELAATFAEAWVSGWRPLHDDGGDGDPVFLIGFPRSGTTLLDQILDSHPALATLEEKPAVYAMVQAVEALAGGYPSALASLSADQRAAVRSRYFDVVGRFVQVAPGALLVDKFPMATIHAGLVQRVFPRAKFILAVRHPLDVCLSCFMQNFKLNDAMASFTSLEGAAQLYAKVMGLWAVYRRALPLAVHQVRYEDLVAAPEAEARRLLDFLGVGWDDSVLRFSDHARARGRINTPSYHQVSEPIYQRARYRWKRYARQLAPVIGTLQPFIEAFGYADD